MLNKLFSITFRVLVINFVLVFLPIAAILLLDTYEKQLLKTLEDSMVQEARVISAALSNTSSNLQEESKKLILNLRHEHTSRIRVVDKKGNLLADSSTIFQNNLEYKEVQEEKKDTRESTIYKIASLPVRIYRRLLSFTNSSYESSEYYSGKGKLLGSEIENALDGKYGAITRISTGGQISVTLYSALPIYFKDSVLGAVLISKSTYTILRDLYVLRVQVFKVFLWSVFAAVILSFVSWFTVSRPLRILRKRAIEIVDSRGKLTGHFKHINRFDEIGDLSAALMNLTKGLEKHIKFLEGFASDVSHEFKNPLSSIRSAIEVVLNEDDKKEREIFLKNSLNDVSRLEKLITGISDISKIDSIPFVEDLDSIEVKNIIKNIIDSFKLKTGRDSFILNWDNNVNEKILIQMKQDHFCQILENVIDNGISFCSATGEVSVNVSFKNKLLLIEVLDDGPGIKEPNKVFNRFYTFRPHQKTRQDHIGIGLSIVKSIIDKYNGRITAGNNANGGGAINIYLPYFGIS